MTTDTIDAAKLVGAVIGREGGYTNHPADRGGPTCWGITQQVARAYGWAGDMWALPRGVAVDIYVRRYWQEPKFDKVSFRYPAVAALLFDIGVNMGPSVAGAFLQRVLNVFNRGASAYPDLAVDGRLGTMTFSVLDAFRKERGAEGGERLLEAIRSLRGARYIEISESRPANEAFTYGWFGRMVEMLKNRAGK